MRISDWSSDVCSSDRDGAGDELREERDEGREGHEARGRGDVPAVEVDRVRHPVERVEADPHRQGDVQQRRGDLDPEQIGRESGRERVCPYVYISGVAVQIKKKKKII